MRGELGFQNKTGSYETKTPRQDKPHRGVTLPTGENIFMGHERYKASVWILLPWCHYVFSSRSILNYSDIFLVNFEYIKSSAAWCFSVRGEPGVSLCDIVYCAMFHC